jgi:hypothetical protein
MCYHSKSTSDHDAICTTSEELLLTDRAIILTSFTCSLSLQDAADVRNLSLVYTLAGGTHVDSTGRHLFGLDIYSILD